MMTDTRSAVGTRFSRGIALIGVVIGFIAIVLLGAVALLNYNGWKKGRDRYPILAWLIGWFGIVGIVSYLAVYLAVGSRVSDYGGLGSVVMVVGATVGTFLTWRYDLAHAEHPSLKRGRNDPAPPRSDL
jgi:hypothetical protein